MADGLNMSRRIRRTPYTDRVEQVGVRGYSVVNHMLLPKAYARSVEADYWHLREAVQIWDVSCQRQVQITGPDAARLVQLMTPRDISAMFVGQCLYVPIVDENAGLINDPVLLKLAVDRFWLSIADSDLLLYAKGLAIGFGLEVNISEPDVSPLAIQGPRAEDLLAELFGAHIRNIGFFKFGHVEFEGTQQLIARSGYSRKGGFEFYLNDSALGGALWDAIWEAGQPFDIAPGCPNLIERIEGGLFSYGNEMTRDNNPFEIGLGKFCSFAPGLDYVGRAALERIRADGHVREIRGLVFGDTPCATCATPWPVMVEGQQVGGVTSAIWSPRLHANVGLSMIARDYWGIGTELRVLCADGQDMQGQIVSLPMG